jgi:tetratricopeptide (TPR) repeat protein
MILEDSLYKKITELTDKGNDAFENDLDLALMYYEEALALVPDPKTDWEASTWLYTAIGDAYYFKKEYQSAIDSLNKAMMCPTGIGNAFICLRLGECFFELSNYTHSKDFLMQAYMLEGKDIFEYEESKYIKSIEELL